MLVKIDREYNIFQNWNDIKHSDFMKIVNVVQSFPEGIKSALKGIEADFELADYLDCQKAMLEVCSDIPRSILDRCAILDVNTFFESLRYIVDSILIAPVFAPLGKMHFGEYVLSRSDLDVVGNEQPLSEMTALEMCEVADLQMSDMWLFGKNIFTILCRPVGEKYNEKVSKDRAREIDPLMSDILEVYAKIGQFHAYCKGSYPNLYGGGGKENKLSGFGWGGRILWLAEDSTVEQVEQLNAYEFMRRLSFKIAKYES